jgi:hypothetical protein
MAGFPHLGSPVGRIGWCCARWQPGSMRELDQRNGDGFLVTLLWSEDTGSVFVCVDDERTEEAFHFSVDPADALEAFRHPYAYSTRTRLSEVWG